MNQITQLGFFESTAIADRKDGGGTKTYSPPEIAIQILFDQHFMVDVELNSGVIHKSKYVRPATNEVFCWLTDAHSSGSEHIAGSSLVLISAITAIHFQKNQTYSMTQPR